VNKGFYKDFVGKKREMDYTKKKLSLKKEEKKE